MAINISIKAGRATVVVVLGLAPVGKLMHYCSSPKCIA